MRHTQNTAIQYPLDDNKLSESLPNKQYRPSFSALAVIYCLHALAGQKRWHELVPFEDVAFYRFCLEHYSRYSALLSLIYRLPEAWCVKTVELALAYGAPQHFAFRKQKIRTIISQVKHQGISQIVSIGAGFDLELFRASNQDSQVNCIELDTPLMVSDKEKLLLSNYQTIPSNFHLLGADLALESIESALLGTKIYDAGKKTLFILEGVSMYLEEKQVEDLLAQLSRIKQSGSQFVFTALEPARGSQNAFFAKLGGWLLSSHQESYHWRIKQAEVVDFLACHGMNVVESISYSNLQNSIRNVREMNRLEKQAGEYLVWASFG